MFKRDTTTRTVIIQDDSPKNPFNTSEFVHWMNQTVCLFDQRYEGPAKCYQNALVKDTDRYNAFQDLTTEMSKQFIYLCGMLKAKGLPVVMPDYQYYEKAYEQIKTYDDATFVAAMQKEVTLLEKSLKLSIDSNVKTAKAHNIPLEKPANINTIAK